MSDGILFPVPTITATLPAVVSLASVRTQKEIVFYTISQDEWRQEEFLNISWQATITKEFSIIRAISPDSTEQNSYPRMHLRRLSGLWGIRLDQIQKSLQIPDGHWRRLAFEETSGIVANSFAVRFGHTLLYGQQKNGVTETLGLIRHYFPPTPSVDIELLSRFVSTTNCCLVDWCQAKTYLPFTDDLKKHFQ
jgi:hypothetical protein